MPFLRRQTLPSVLRFLLTPPILRPGLALLALAGVVLALGCPGGGGGGGVGPSTLEARPKVVEVTAGQQVTLGYIANNLPAGGVEYLLPDPDSGLVDANGLYTAPFRVGKYYALLRSKALPGLQDQAEIHVDAAPVARSFAADRNRIRPGDSVVLTAEFEGGKAVLYPGALDLVSGTPVTLKPVQDTTYILRVTNTLGVVVEKTLVIQVEGMLRHLNNIVAPDVARLGNYHVAWVERRVGSRLEWSSDGVVFLGGQEHPTTPVVVFTPKAGVSTFKLTVRTWGGNQLAPLASSSLGRSVVDLARAGLGPRTLKQAGPRAAGSPVNRAGDLPGHLDAQAQEEVTFDVEGKVELPTGDEPVIRLERPFFTAGKSGCKAWVENEKPGTTYVWGVQHGPSQEPVGPKVELTAGQGDFMLITCKATVPGGQPRATTTAVGLVQAPPPPVIRVGGEPVAGVRQYAYVKGGNPGDTQHWEIEPGKGVLDAASGPMAGFTVREPGPFKLICRTETQAGEMSEPATLTLTAVGPFSLDPPKVLWPDYLRADTDCTLAVDNPPPGLVFNWRIELGGTATSPAGGASLNLRTGSGAEPLLVICTAKEPATGASSTASRNYTLVKRPARPMVLAPAQVAPGTDFVASVVYGARPGERFEWTPRNADLQASPLESGEGGPRRAEPDERRVVVLKSGVVGRYAVQVVTVNQAGDRSEPCTVEGNVAVPGVTAPATAASGAPEAPGAVTAGLHVAYDSLVLEQGDGVHQTPVVRNAMGDARFEVMGEFPRELTFDPRSGRISGNVVVPRTYRFQVAATSGSLSGLSGWVVYQVKAAPAGQRGPGEGSGQDGALSIAYASGEFASGVELPEPRLPRVGNAVGGTTFRLAWGGLPEGLELNPATGAITGTPGQARLMAFKVEVRDQSGRTAISEPVNYAVAGSSGLSLDYPPMPRLAARKKIPAETLKPVLTGNMPGAAPVYEAVGTLPRGVIVDRSTGEILGTPLEPGDFQFTVKVQDWHRSAIVDPPLTCHVDPGADPGFSYPPLAVFHTRTPRISLTPQTLGDDVLPYYTFSLEQGTLPEGLELDGINGEFKGRIQQPGVYHFVVKKVGDLDMVPGVHVHEEFAAPVTIRVDPFVDLVITSLRADSALLVPGQTANLTLEYQGVPTRMTLTQDQCEPPATPGEVLPPDQDPVVFNEIRPSGTTLPVTVRRRRTFTLELAGQRERVVRSRIGRRVTETTALEEFTTQRQLTLAIQGMDAVAGLAIDDRPSGAYADGAADAAALPEIVGLAWSPAGLLVSEGSQQTLRRFDAADQHWRLFKGVAKGPDEGTLALPGRRLNQPGPMVAHNGYLYVGDVGSHTLKRVALDGSGEVEIYAGGRNQPATPHPVDGPRLTARFGRIMDLAVYNNVLYVADFDHGIRMVDLGTEQVATLHQGNGGYRMGTVLDAFGGNETWVDFRHPVALAVGGAGPRPIVFLAALKNANGHDTGSLIQVLTPHDANAAGVATHWDLTRYAGRTKGFALGSVSAARFKKVAGLLVAGNDLLAVDQESNAILRIDLAARQVSVLAGAGPNANQSAGQVDHPTDGLQARFNKPSRIVPGRDGNEFWVADSSGTALRRIVRGVEGNLDAVAVSTLARVKPIPIPQGTVRTRYLEGQDGVAGKARFAGPFGLAVDPGTGDAFVADMQPHAVRRVSLRGSQDRPAGTVTTYAGKLLAAFGARESTGGGTAGLHAAPPVLAEQPLAASRLLFPTELALDGLGRLFILEDAGRRIRMVEGEAVHPFCVNIPARNVKAGELPPGSHIAARPGGDDAQLLALSHTDPAQLGHWKVGVCRVAPGETSVTLDRFQNVPLPHPALEPRALAFSPDGRLHVAVQDRDLQRCVIQAFEHQAAPAPGGWVAVGAALEFGPGVDVEPFRSLGFPVVEAMAFDSRGNLFLTDSANAVVWMVPVNSGRVVIVAGDPPTRRPIGPVASLAFGRPLLQPRGIVVTLYDDLLVTDGNVLVQITAPGTPEFPYTPPSTP